jgi:tRNA A37 methylthiotransferase MiaB
MSDQIPESAKTIRSNLLRSTVDESRNLFIKKINGIMERIIVESEHPVRGLTSNYLHVEIPDLKAKHNTWIEVSITGKIQGRFCLAEPVIYEVV